MGGGSAASAHSAESLVSDALAALAHGDHGAFQWAADQLTVHPEVTGTPAADRALMRALSSAVTAAWQRGWQPADIVRFTERRLGRPEAMLATDMIVAELRSYAAMTVSEQFEAQLAALNAQVWWDDDDRHLEQWSRREQIIRPEAVAAALHLLQVLRTLPRLATLGPLPGQARRTEHDTSTSTSTSTSTAAGAGATAGARSGRAAGAGQDAGGGRDAGAGKDAGAGRAADRRMLDRIRALLAKAESTEFPEEAEALSTRAQELMARHSIDHALLAAESGAEEAPGGRRLAVDNPYEAPKAVLLNVVANANRCRAIWHKELGLATVLGFPADLDAVELMFTSLLVQANTAMMHSGSRQDRVGRSRTRSFRHSFLSAYAQRIGERLAEAKDEAVKQAMAETTGGALLPVLARREESVDRAVEAMFPKLIRHRAGRVNNYEGWVAGRAAADLASLRNRAEVRSR